jgi:pimeloyl-ACP methyl ester carboxylesterase
MTDHRLTLPSGRCLSYAEFGASTGVPVIYCHGFPGSRLEAAIADAVASSRGARLIAVDRPGFGLSDCCPGRTILAWADDVREMADRLELDRFSVLGVSGGAPYALACAFKLTRRIRSTAIVSGLGPPESVSDTSPTSTSGFGLRLARKMPWAIPLLSSALAVMARHASPLLLALLSARAGRLDRRTLNDTEFRSVLAESLREAFRSGARCAVTDLKLLSAPWGFDLDRLHAPVQIWHGERDRVVPAAMGRCLERALPTCRAIYLEEHGHYSLVHDRADEILSRLIE